MTDTLTEIYKEEGLSLPEEEEVISPSGKHICNLVSEKEIEKRDCRIKELERHNEKLQDNLDIVLKEKKKQAEELSILKKKFAKFKTLSLLFQQETEN